MATFDTSRGLLEPTDLGDGWSSVQELSGRRVGERAEFLFAATAAGPVHVAAAGRPCRGRQFDIEPVECRSRRCRGTLVGPAMWTTQAVVRVADLPVSLSEFVAATRAELVKVTDVASAAGTAVLASDVDIPGLGPDDRAVRLDYPAGATACLAVVATGQAASVLAFMPAPNEQLLTQAVEAARHRLTEPS